MYVSHYIIFYHFFDESIKLHILNPKLSWSPKCYKHILFFLDLKTLGTFMKSWLIGGDILSLPLTVGGVRTPPNFYVSKVGLTGKVLGSVRDLKG